MNNRLPDIVLQHLGQLRKEEKSFNVHHFKFRVAQMEQIIARQKVLLAHYNASLGRLRKRLQKIETRLDAIAA